MQGKEVKIAIVIGIIMITICLIVFVTVNSKNKVNTLNLKVSKLYEKVDENGKQEYYYKECNVATEDQVYIYKEAAKALSLTEEDLVTGKQIKGNYKVQYNGKMIAFDAIENEDFVYLKDTDRLYNFQSDMYKTVKNACD